MIETQRHRGTEVDNNLTYKIIGAAMEVHRTLGGPGLLESIYESALCYELTLQGLTIKSQVPVEVCYKGVIVQEDPLILDILVENQIIVEVNERLISLSLCLLDNLSVGSSLRSVLNTEAQSFKVEYLSSLF
jgi:hypothetical protein